VKENSEMEMRSQLSLYEIHFINVKRRRRRSRLVARRLIARIFVFLTKATRAIEAELAARQAMTELAEMNDYMLRDLGIVRSDIPNMVRRPRANARTDDAPIPPNDGGEHVTALLSVDSPRLASEAQPEREPRKLHLSR
jgi:uncharacterized protein YjiS (DUF1127 family)